MIEEVGGHLQNVDKQLGALLTALRLAVRFRWEMVRPFSSKVQRLARNPRKLRLDLQTCFNNILREGEFRGIYTSEDVWDAFESSDDKSKISAMMENYEHTYSKIWEGIGFIDATETYGEVSDKPFLGEESVLLDTGLRDLEKMNKDFLEIAVVRAAVLIQREIGITGPQTV
jgi:hypothetical protein